ncbi:MAG: SpoIIE family protein phosphatase [Bacteroidales bacterium]|nr:SpoIIE family protein phosphatase [Bacteroidales bacterium]
MEGRLARSVRIVTGILCCLVILQSAAYSQSYRFRNYSSENGLPGEFIYTIVQDDKGYLWTGTGSGLTKFDGFIFYRIDYPDNVSGRYTTAGIKDSKGRLWFGCNDGTIFYTSADDRLVQVAASNTREITSILEGPGNFIYVIPQLESVLKIDPENPEAVTTFKIDPGIMMLSACFTGQGDLLIGTQQNISKCRISGDTFTIVDTLNRFNYFFVTAIEKTGDGETYAAGTNGNGVFRLDLSGEEASITRFNDDPAQEMLDIESIFEDRDRNLWLSTNGSGLFRISFDDTAQSVSNIQVFNKTNGLPGDNAKIVYQDLEDNYWIGLFGDGLSMLNSLSFSSYIPGDTPETNNIIYVGKYAGKYLLGTPEGYWLYDEISGEAGSFTALRQITGSHEISSYCIDDNDNLWIGTRGGGVYLRDTSGSLRLFYRNGNTSEDYVTDIDVDDRYIWLGSLNGVIILERNIRAARVVARYNNSNGLPHNMINQIYLTGNGTAALAMKSDRLYTVDPEKGVIPGKAVMYGTTMNEIVAVCESSDGHLWAATKGNGVFEFFSDSLRSYSRTDMLMSDYCYSIIADSLDRIWIGHQSGFSRYNRKTEVMRTFGNDFARGGLCNTHALYESPDGMIFIGTNQGFITYDPSHDFKTTTAPLNNINFISINDSVYPLRSSYTLPYRKRYNIVVNYVGIHLGDPEKVYYQTFLKNYEEDWAPLSTQREVRYTPAEGRYSFEMRSFFEDGMTLENPASFDLVIKKPFWRTWWFVLTSVLLTVSAFFLIIRQREKAQRKLQSYLEKELAARTSVVMKQKDKIEQQNTEITDSINYAKRIQSSILPDVSKLKDTFREAFVLFRPRDIVSGDFYWFDKVSDEKFILVCADSTGHGVPGAFMSMIGSTLLQDIVLRQHITRPSDILKMLDEQIFATLNQNIELGVSNDGMDMVVCEINTKKGHIRFASAMRPVIMVVDRETLYIKGNRYSVGGESVVEKYFDDQEYYLKKGDTIYLFSDGLPDQFGGADGKKMKIARLKKLIEDITELPMEDQKRKVLGFLDEWTGAYEQIDDILMIGVRF